MLETVKLKSACVSKLIFIIPPHTLICALFSVCLGNKLNRS